MIKRILFPVTFLLLLNAAIRSAWLYFYHPQQISDFNWYYTHAVSLFKGLGYHEYGHPTAFYPIGQPLFLSLVFRFVGHPSVLVGQITEATLSTCIVLLIFFIARHITNSVPIAFFSGLIYTLLPSQIAWNSMLGSEELFTFLMILSIFFYLKGTNKVGFIILSGLAMGLACDTRSILLLFPPFIFIYEWITNKKINKHAIKNTLFFTFSMIASVLPVTIRNFLKLGHLIPVSTNGGQNLWQGIHTNGGYYWSTNPKVNPLFPLIKNEVAENKLGTHIFEQYVLHHPIEFLTNGLVKIWDLYKTDNNAIWWLKLTNQRFFTGSSYNTMLSIFAGAYHVIIIVSLLGLLLTFFHRKVLRASALPLIYLFYNTVIFIAFPAWDRFRYPMMPFYSIFFVLMFVHFYQFFLAERKITQPLQVKTTN